MPKIKTSMQNQLCRHLFFFTYEALALPLPLPEPSKEVEDPSDKDEMDVHLFNDTLTSLLKWIEKGGFDNEFDSVAQEALIKHVYIAAKHFNVVKIVTLPTPSPPPPCMQPHYNKEDVHMEPPTPTHMFNEAAIQTPAPLPIVAMPPPPPSSMLPAFIFQGCRENPLPYSPPFVWQFFIEMLAVAGISLPGLIDQANTALSHVRSSLHIDSVCLANSGITCATISVPTQSDLDIVEAMLPPKISGS
ncbi:hypothetical protein P691DRAFT_768252 [Macrolepiota fuliginosa MF-IS2]|uniref:Uncharacterized protein n=1 Tax=Macrolepiota fuliginosa MF-IS2 TaxID=1400762 RepID=A0A9P6BVT0_9AGAR|nr:hypothetical protein P691DRAFT_768252 [Macrolepiota fuliginosa MF-IS2]